MIDDGNITLEKKAKNKSKSGNKSGLNEIKRVKNKSKQRKSALYKN